MSVRSSRPLPLLLALSSVIGLGACVAPPQPNRSAGLATILPTSFAPAPVPTPSSPPTEPGTPSLADLSSGPQHFEGLEGKTILAALGDPNFRRRETPAEVWQYYGPGCILDLFLYDEPHAGSTKAADGAPVPEGNKVAHAELRGRENAPADATCLSRLIDQRYRRASS